MKAFDLDALVRPNVLSLSPYSSARDEFEGEAEVYLDANENPFPTRYNRYPDPHHRAVKAELAPLLGLDPRNIFLGNGSDEAIDLLFRVFCRPGQDRIVSCPPTYGMYKVSAGVNDIGIDQVPLTDNFQPDLKGLSSYFDSDIHKLLFLCSPNNPTGNLMERNAVKEVLEQFKGMVVVDEAYIDFAPDGSLSNLLAEYPNLVVLRTFSKAWGLAGLRLGMALASPEVIGLMDRIKPPYNVNLVTQRLALEALHNRAEMGNMVREIIQERERLIECLNNLEGVVKVYPSDANFLLVEFLHPHEIFRSLRQKGIIVRDRTQQVHNCLRITVGTPNENQRLLQSLELLLLPDISIH